MFTSMGASVLCRVHRHTQATGKKNLPFTKINFRSDTTEAPLRVTLPTEITMEAVFPFERQASTQIIQSQ